MINEVVIVGRITKKPELKSIDNNLSVTYFYVAVDNSRGASGQKTTSFIPVKVWNNQAINVCKYTTKGSLVGVKGFLKQNKYTKTDGSIVNTIEVVANSVTFLDSRNKENMDIDKNEAEEIDNENAERDEEIRNMKDVETSDSNGQDDDFDYGDDVDPF